MATKHPFERDELDLAIMIRVMHHLPNPEAEFKSIYEALKSEGMFILEVANSSHFKNRLKYATQLKGVPKGYIDVRSDKNKAIGSIPFGQHSITEVVEMLNKAGFKLKDKLSVSNFRFGALKKALGKGNLLKLEGKTQKPLAKMNFGPSIFLVLEKK
jgi:SAM-dependent methyltransferase